MLETVLTVPVSSLKNLPYIVVHNLSLSFHSRLEANASNYSASKSPPRFPRLFKSFFSLKQGREELARLLWKFLNGSTTRILLFAPVSNEPSRKRPWPRARAGRGSWFRDLHRHFCRTPVEKVVLHDNGAVPFVGCRLPPIIYRNRVVKQRQ